MSRGLNFGRALSRFGTTYAGLVKEHGMRYEPRISHGARADDGWTYMGLKTVVIENEIIRTVVLADKGADIVSLSHKATDLEFLWRSPSGVRDPNHYVPTTSDAPATYIDYYEGGWQTVVPAGGAPSTYRGAAYGLHGEVNMMPWDVAIVEQGPDECVVRFVVNAARSPLRVMKEFRLAAGSPILRIKETVANLSDEPFPVVWGQHIAFGPPFLSSDCVIDLPGGTVHGQPEDYGSQSRLAPGAASRWPFGVLKNGAEVDLRRVLEPHAGVLDMAYIGNLNDGWYAIRNTVRSVGFALRFPVEIFRYVWYWQVFGGGSGYPWWGQAYVAGLEPFTSYPNTGLAEAIQNGTALEIPSREEIEVEIVATVFAADSEVQAIKSDGSVVT
jgi:hypothetical protein